MNVKQLFRMDGPVHPAHAEMFTEHVSHTHCLAVLGCDPVGFDTTKQENAVIWIDAVADKTLTAAGIPTDIRKLKNHQLRAFAKAHLEAALAYVNSQA